VGLGAAPEEKEMLAGEIRPDDTAYAVRTTQQMLVELAGWYVRNSVALATLITDLGDPTPGLRIPEAAAVLPSLGTDVLGGGWLEQMRSALSHPAVLLQPVGCSSTA